MRVLTPDVADRWPEKLRAVAVGPATALAISRTGVKAQQFNEGTTGADLVRALPPVNGKSVFLPQGDRNDPTVEQMLAAAGATVKTAVVYRTTDALPSPAARSELGRGVDAIVFYSPSAVQSFRALELSAPGAAFVCVGPTTGAAAGKIPGARVVIARDTTMDAIVDAVAGAVQTQAGNAQ
jgi:uroporphyrinogen-III synthase